MTEQITDLFTALMFGLPILAALYLYIYCIVDISKRKVKYESRKAVWLNIVWFAPVIGSIIYLFNRDKLWN